jgi:hypothetical protein
LVSETAVQLESLLAVLRATPGLVSVPPPVVASELSAEQHQQVQGLLCRLQALLQQDDPEAQALWMAHASLMHAGLQQADLLEQAIDRFDFEEALVLLQTAG